MWKEKIKSHRTFSWVDIYLFTNFIFCQATSILRVCGVSMMAHGKECCQCRGHEFNPRSRRIPCASEELSPCIRTIEPALYSMGSTAAAPTLCHYCSPWQEKLLQPMTGEAAARRRLCTATRAKPVQQQGPSRAPPKKRVCARTAEAHSVLSLPTPWPEQWALQASPRVPGSSPSRIQGNPQDERHRWERDM